MCVGLGLGYITDMSYMELDCICYSNLLNGVNTFWIVIFVN
jgi:hypothetical protein